MSAPAPQKLEVGRVGESVKRVDAIPKVTGEFVYASDLIAAGMLWGHTVRSPHAHARIVEIDRSIDHRTEVAEQLGITLPLELLRRRFGLAQLDVEILSMLFALESGGAFNPYDTRSTRTERVEPEVAFFMALLSGGERDDAERVRARFLPDAPLSEIGRAHV